jgi:hypothetical protein
MLILIGAIALFYLMAAGLYYLIVWSYLLWAMLHAERTKQ